MKNVEGKVILITGASSGIGRETAKVLAQNGAKVVLSARREDRLKELAGEIGENAAYLTSDVTRLEDGEALVSLTQERVWACGCVPPDGTSQEKAIDPSDVLFWENAWKNRSV